MSKKTFVVLEGILREDNNNVWSVGDTALNDVLTEYETTRVRIIIEYED